jgi:hypothetical protein
MPGDRRWQVTPPPPESFTISEYLQRLFKAQPGRYRVIVFVVTGDPVVPGYKPPSAEEMDARLVGGATMLSEGYRALPAKNAHCEALIYEFFRRSTGSEVRFVAKSKIAPVRHLTGAGLWTVAELSP